MSDEDDLAYQRFSELLKQNRVSQSAFARMAGVSRITVGRWKKRGEVPRWAVLLLKEPEETPEEPEPEPPPEPTPDRDEQWRARLQALKNRVLRALEESDDRPEENGTDRPR